MKNRAISMGRDAAGAKRRPRNMPALPCHCSAALI